MSLFKELKETMSSVREKHLDTEKYQVFAAGYLDGLLEGGRITSIEYKELNKLIDPTLSAGVMELLDMGEIPEIRKHTIYLKDEK
jgi:hypothetical protein